MEQNVLIKRIIDMEQIMTVKENAKRIKEILEQKHKSKADINREYSIFVNTLTNEDLMNICEYEGNK